MDEVKYIHGLIFNKQGELNNIYYESKIKLYNIHRIVNIRFNFTYSNVEAYNSLILFASNYQKHFEKMIDLLVCDASNNLLGKQVSDSELTSLINIDKKYEILYFISYNYIQIYNDKAVINMRCEWNYEAVTSVVLTKNGVDIIRKSNSIVKECDNKKISSVFTNL